MRGAGTLLNIATILAGASGGVLIGQRLTTRMRDTVTDGIGLVALMVAVLDGSKVLDPALSRSVGASAPVLIVLGSVLAGGIAGSALRIEDGLDRAGGALQRRLAAAGKRIRLRPGHAEAGRQDGAGPPGHASDERERFIQGFVTASLIYCVGPLTVLGSLQDGLGQGFSQLALKSTLDGFTSLALAASFGWGVAASALSVLVIQGSLTAAAAALGGVMTAAEIAAMTATGGLLLAGLALRLLRLRSFPVGDLLPALVAAPLITLGVASLR
jgi:uncharacterized protein